MPPPAEAAPSAALNLAAVDTSACPAESGPDPVLRENPLEPPEAEDELEDNPPTLAAAQTSVSPAAAGVNADLRPTLRAPNDPTYDAPAADDAGTANVELGLRWCVVQRTSARTYDWAPYDARFNLYLQNGVGIKTVRIVDPPVWAVGTGCPDRAQTGSVKMCPPRAETTIDNQLRDFAKAAAQHYGPGTTFGVDRFSFWNEPNLWKNWGYGSRWTSSEERSAAHRYSDRLKVFSFGVQYGNQGVKVDAGEVAAGGPTGSNGVRSWAKDFTDYNTAENRNGRYNVLTIHAYSEEPWQLPHKVSNYKGLSGVESVGVTEFGWAVKYSAGHWKCADDQEDQRHKLNLALDQARNATVGFHRLVWFSAIDNRKNGDVKCPSSDYDVSDEVGNPVRTRMNTYGLYRRPRNGTLTSFGDTTPRLLRTAFLVAQSP